MSSDNRMSFANVPQVLYENRYCNQEGFSVLACVGIDKTKMFESSFKGQSS